MNLLIDRHALLWWLGATDKLSSRARDTLRSPVNRVYVSAAVAWELAIKVNLGKLDASELVSDLPRVLFEKGFRYGWQSRWTMPFAQERFLSTIAIPSIECWLPKRKLSVFPS